jgi:hypothetical protein
MKADSKMMQIRRLGLSHHNFIAIGTWKRTRFVGNGQISVSERGTSSPNAM